MADRKFYPGGEKQYWADKGSDDLERQKMADLHDWAADPPPDNSGDPGRPGKARLPRSSDAGSGDEIEEILRWRTIPVVAIVYAVFRYTSLWQKFGRKNKAWDAVIFIFLFVALTIISPTLGKKLAALVIGTIIFGFLVLVLLSLYSGNFSSSLFK
jgi:hypothetical protein